VHVHDRWEAIAFDGQDYVITPVVREISRLSPAISGLGRTSQRRGFILLHLVVDGSYLTRAVVQEDGVLTAVDLHNSPVLTERAQHADPTSSNSGAPHKCGDIASIPERVRRPNDICIGYDPAVTATANFESLSRFEWDGEIGYGHTERSVRLA